MFNFSNSTKTEIISIVNTFLATFLSIVAVTASSHIEWTLTFWSSLAIAGIRAGIKAVINQFVPTTLGGVKK